MGFSGWQPMIYKGVDMKSRQRGKTKIWGKQQRNSMPITPTNYCTKKVATYEAEIINQSMKVWNQPLIPEIFWPLDSKNISSIPLG